MGENKRTYVVYINGKVASTTKSRKSAVDLLDSLKEPPGTYIRWGYYEDEKRHAFIPIEDYHISNHLGGKI